MNINTREKIFRTSLSLQKFKNLNAIRNGFITLVPFLLLHSFFLVIMEFPIPSYQAWIDSSSMSAITTCLNYLNSGIINYFSLFLTLSIGFAYANNECQEDHTKVILPFVSAAAFLISTGVALPDFNASLLGKTGLFTAIISSLFCCKFYVWISDRMNDHIQRLHKNFDTRLADMIHSIFPAFFVLATFALINYIIHQISDGLFIQEIFVLLIRKLMSYTYSGNLLSTALYFLLVQTLWFFGVHAPNALYEINNIYFGVFITKNVTAVQNGLVPESIFNTTFHNCFLNLGGSGATLCLILAILLFGKCKASKRISRVSILPGLFNINEIMVYGIPLTFNLIYLIPFLLIPILNLCVSYLATITNFIPVISTELSRITPLLISGYLATGTIRGVLLQIFLLILDTLIYTPFVLLENEQEKLNYCDTVQVMTKLHQAHEENNEPMDFRYESDAIQDFSKLLIHDLQEVLEKEDKKELFMLYQPQFTHENKCIGAEALLRWNHPIAGFIYPPLIISLAKEGNLLSELEMFIFREACKMIQRITTERNLHYKISVNVTSSSLKRPNFETALYTLVDEYQIAPEDLWIEITEQDALSSSAEIVDLLMRIKNRGHKLLIDDFGMGHTSINYLQTNLFDIVKLDGSITRTVISNTRNQNIISSIVFLSGHLYFDIISEYVENEEQRDKLVALGCHIFQGYLYSRPISADQLMEHLIDS